MAEEMSPEQIAELQRKNCIFCKIVAGEMESKKVFEDEHFLAVLDIKPATPGHILLLPKEHVPILPLLSEEKMFALFELITKLSDAVQDAVIAQRTTVFIASGYAAGQQAPHLIVHIIPREKGDGLDILDAEHGTTSQSDTLALADVFAQATKQALMHRGREDLVKQHHIHKKEPIVETKVPVTTPGGQALVDAKGISRNLHTTLEPDSPEDTPQRIVQDQHHNRDASSGAASYEEFETTNEALAAALSANADLRRLIIAQPDLVADYVKKSPRLGKLFEGVNMRALSLMLQRQEAAQQKPLAKVAKEMTDEELFAFIDGNQGLRTWITDNPLELAARLAENPRLQQFFRDTDIEALSRKYKQSRGMQ